MLNKKDIQNIIDECREMGTKGLGNGVQANIKELQVDFLSPPNDFLGLAGNPAIFINQHTHKLLGKAHPSWQPNQTIAVKEDFLKNNAMLIIGILVHEIGHAFNVAADIPNSEFNAYIFEIEVINSWFAKKSPLLFDCSKADVQGFFSNRLPYYHSETRKSAYLNTLVKKVEENSSDVIFTPNP